MKSGIIIQLGGLTALTLLAGFLSFDGVAPEVVVLLVMGILAIAAPEAFNRLVARWGGDR